ncbi:HAUS6 protein, partial [Corythaixoides concolor]|nr:HAUS6 protein [Corythaixoides concolor]
AYAYRMKQNKQTKNDRTEKIQKVRSMWTLIMEMLTSLKKEKEVVDSVLDKLEDCADEYTLDGTAVVLRVPQLLACRVQNARHDVCTGDIYEAGKLNFLTVIQLLNEALRTLRDECCQLELKQPVEQFWVLGNRIALCNELLKNLQANRLKIEQEHRVSVSGSVSRTQEDWEVKWKSFLGQCPFNLMLDQNPVSSVQLM